ncbi:FAD-dependent oxidoreductase [Aeromicrobium sp.]|uniref:FAD-dependent oxidoreductase n=1 Tax=Aeromicrobium sp. TaxID=1871063 RepID=UPI003C524FF9
MRAATGPRDLLDRQLGRVTMYRLVTVVLAALVVVTLGFTIGGTFNEPYSVTSELATLTVLLVVTYVSSRGFGLLWSVTAHGESAIITALLLWFLFTPSTDPIDLAWIAAAGVLAGLSKYVLAWHGRHVFNPAAAGAFGSYAVQYAIGRDAAVSASWWVGNQTLLPFVATGAFLVLWRTRRLDVGLVFIATAAVLIVLGLDHLAPPEAPLIDPIRTMAYSFPIVFLGGFMLSEPLTLPPRRLQQLVVAAVTGAVFSYPIWVFMLTTSPPDLRVLAITPGVALLIGNVVAFGFSRRRGVALVLDSSRTLTSEINELTFRAKRPLRFLPGQYMELTVPHSGADGRGTRRSFSISSPPSSDGLLSFALRVPDPSSSFKRALRTLQPGATVHATGVGGDFLLPSDPEVPVLLVAGGIGITPFLSQLRHQPARDAVLVYGVSSPDEVAFIDELTGFRVVLVAAAQPVVLPEGWAYVEAPSLSADLIAAAVPDLAGRRAYVSGPPAMVNALRPGLAKHCGSVRTDYFTGY